VTLIKPIAHNLFKRIIGQIIRSQAEITNENIGRKKEAQAATVLWRPRRLVEQ
jgi:hypothetical protein